MAAQTRTSGVRYYKGIAFVSLTTKGTVRYRIITRDGPRRKNYPNLSALQSAVNAWEHKQLRSSRAYKRLP